MFKRILGEATTQPLSLAATVAVSVAGAGATLLVPRLIGRVVDQLHALLGAGGGAPDHARATLLAGAGLLLASTTLRGLLAAASNFLGERQSQMAALALRLRYFDALQRQSFAFHDQVHSGDLITRGMLDLEGVRGFIQAVLVNALPLVLLIGLAAGLMGRADPFLTVISLGFVPLAGWVLARAGVLLRRAWFQVQEQLSALSLVMEENLQGVRVVRAFAAERFELAKFDRAAQAVVSLQFSRITLRMAAWGSLTSTFHLSLGLLLWLGGRKVMAGQMSVGQLAAFVAYLTALQSPIRQIAMIFNNAARAASSGARLYEILDRAPDIVDPPDAPALAPTAGVLRLDHVSFRYAGSRAYALTDVSLEVRPGRTLGIVGAPGSGKSTLAALIPRFYDVEAGSVTIDGVDVRSVSLASLRRYVGVVQQEAFLFDAPIGHNLAYADPWAEDDRIRGAASVAQLHEHVARLPDGYETPVGERGVSLSGGQRQRAAIARGVLPGPGILIFDDSTAAIDAVTEERVRRGLAELTRHKATIIIAHRLSSLSHADEILVLERGRVVERGDHAALMALGGAYARLYALQSHQARDGERAAEARGGELASA